MSGDREGDLVVGTADTAGLNFEVWGDISEGFFEDLYGVFAFELFGCSFDSGIDSSFGDLFFAVKHGFVD